MSDEGQDQDVEMSQSPAAEADADTEPAAAAEETPAEREAKALAFKAEGNKKYSAKDYPAAVTLYTQAIETFARPEFYGNRAASLIAMKRYKPALSDCLAAIELDASYRKAYIRGTKCYTELADFAAAQKLAQNGLERFPADKELKQGLDRVGIIQNKLSRIESKLSTVSAKYNAMYEDILNPSENTQNSASDANSEADEKSESKNNNYAKIQHTLSSEDTQQMDVALGMINALMSNELSQSVPLKCTQIRALLIAQKTDQALSAATNVLRWNKDSAEVMQLRAIALVRNGNSDSAIKHLQQVLRKDPDNKDARRLFKHFKAMDKAKKAGNNAFKANELDEAITRYSACLRLDVANLSFCCVIYANRAAVWLKQKEYKNAYDDATQAIDLDKTYIKAYGRRIQALYGLDRYDEAVGDAERALKLEPSSQELKQQLRQAQIELKKSKRKNYYKILGVKKDATEKEIKKGFRKKAMQWHPDKYASDIFSDEERAKAEATFKEIGEAYEVLKDPKLKQRYDSGVDIENLKSGGMGGMGGGMGGVDISHIFDLLGGMQGGGGGGMPGGFTFTSGGMPGRGGHSFRFG